MKNCFKEKTEPSEIDWLHVYDMIHWWKIVLRTEPRLGYFERSKPKHFLVQITTIINDPDYWIVIIEPRHVISNNVVFWQV